MYHNYLYLIKLYNTLHPLIQCSPKLKSVPWRYVPNMFLYRMICSVRSICFRIARGVAVGFSLICGVFDHMFHKVLNGSLKNPIHFRSNIYKLGVFTIVSNNNFRFNITLNAKCFNVLVLSVPLNSRSITLFRHRS